MQTRLLKDIISEITGKQGADIVDLLQGKKNVNEFLIAKKLKLTINQTRNILYKLSAHNLVSFTRKKDKRKGWYIYFWTLNEEKCLGLLEKIINKELDNLRNQLKSRQTKRFYECKTCNIEVSEEKALINDFACKECGQIYTLSGNEQIQKEIKQRVSRLEKERENIEQEMGKIREKETKKRNRREAREKKEKKLKRKLAAKKRAKTRAKNKALKEKASKKKKTKSKKKTKKKKSVKKKVKKTKKKPKKKIKAKKKTKTKKKK